MKIIKIKDTRIKRSIIFIVLLGLFIFLPTLTSAYNLNTGLIIFDWFLGLLWLIILSIILSVILMVCLYFFWIILQSLNWV
jgi:hypothetical protein